MNRHALLEKFDSLRSTLETLLVDLPLFEAQDPFLIEDALEAHDACLDAMEAGEPAVLEMEALEQSLVALRDARDRHDGPTEIPSINRVLAWLTLAEEGELNAVLAVSLIRGEAERLRSRGDCELVAMVQGLAQGLQAGELSEAAVAEIIAAAERAPRTGIAPLDRMLLAWAGVNGGTTRYELLVTAVDGVYDWADTLERALEPLLASAHGEQVEELLDLLEEIGELAQSSLNDGRFAWRSSAEDVVELALNFRELTEIFEKALAQAVGTTGSCLDVRVADEPAAAPGLGHLHHLVAAVIDGQEPPDALLDEIDRLRRIVARLSSLSLPPATDRRALAPLDALREAFAILEEGATQGRAELMWRGAHSLDQAERQLELLRDAAERNSDPAHEQRKIA